MFAGSIVSRIVVRQNVMWKDVVDERCLLLTVCHPGSRKKHRKKTGPQNTLSEHTPSHLLPPIRLYVLYFHYLTIVHSNFETINGSNC
jgi:hypothetical protein